MTIACARSWDLYGHRFGAVDEDESVCSSVWLPQLLPVKANTMGGGSGFHIERLAYYMSAFEADEDGLWCGEQVVAWSGFYDIDDYNPDGNNAEFPAICLDPPSSSWGCQTGVDVTDDAACLVLQETLDEREDKELTDKESEASRYYAVSDRERLCNFGCSP